MYHEYLLFQLFVVFVNLFAGCIWCGHDWLWEWLVVCIVIQCNTNSILGWQHEWHIVLWSTFSTLLTSCVTSIIWRELQQAIFLETSTSFTSSVDSVIEATTFHKSWRFVIMNIMILIQQRYFFGLHIIKIWLNQLISLIK